MLALFLYTVCIFGCGNAANAACPRPVRPCSPVCHFRCCHEAPQLSATSQPMLPQPRGQNDVILSCPFWSFSVPGLNHTETGSTINHTQTGSTTLEQAPTTCRQVYAQYKPESKPTINLALVVGVVLAGMGVVLGLPHLMYTKSGKGSKSWAQQLEESRKVRGGHTL